MKMRALIVGLQVVISVVVTASAMPAILVAVPAAQDDRMGLALVAGLFVLTFLVITLVWPKSTRP